MANKTPLDRASQSTLQRGKACLRCRKRKMRCDGTKPACQQCSRAKKGEACEYDDGKGKTRTQLLRENISRLEQRIRELEDPDYISTAVTLHDPHTLPRPGSTSSSFDSPSGRSHSPYGSDSHTSPQTSWIGLPAMVTPGPANFGNQLFFQDHIQPPPELAHLFLDIFAPHRIQCGLPINMDQLRLSLTLPAPAQHHPALMNVIYLWACFISRPEPLCSHEEHYLSNTLHSIQQSLHLSDRILDVIQASCLLSLYFLSNGRLLEGSYHSSAAAALAVQHKLHLPPSEPRDCFETGQLKGNIRPSQRVLTFWQVYNLELAWSGVLRKPTVIPEEHAIKCPWPLSEYELDHMDSNALFRTLGPFLDGEMCPAGFAAAALRVKATALFARAEQLSSGWVPSRAGSKPSSTFREDVQALENVIIQYVPSLPTLHQMDNTHHDDKYSLLVSHTLVHTAVIRLFQRFAQDDSVSFAKCSRAARSCISIIKHLNDRDFSYLDPIVGSCWAYTADVLIRELDTIETSWPLMSSSTTVRGELATLLYALTGLNSRFCFIAPVITKIQKRLAESQ